MLRKISKLQKKIHWVTNQTKETERNQIEEIVNNLTISINTEKNLEKQELLLLSCKTQNVSNNL